MQRVKLDSIDRRILRDLQQDGRVTNVELAERAGISAPPCLRRVRALEGEGYIQGYHAELNPEKLGFTVIIFAFVGLSSQAENDALAAICAARAPTRNTTQLSTASSRAKGPNLRWK